MTSHQEISAILLSAKSSSDAFAKIYAYKKAKNSKYSLARICRLAGISSRGYLSDIINGKAILHPKYRFKMARALTDNDAEREYLRLLVAIDHEVDTRKKKTLLTKLGACRKVLSVVAPALQTDLDTFLLATEIFCAFGLFKNQPTLHQLTSYFKHRRSDEILGGIKELEHLKFIRKDGDRYQLLVDFALFVNGKMNFTHLDFLRMAMRHATDNVEAWFPQKGHAYFNSTILSVSKKHYEQKLPKIKSQFVKALTDLESGNADLLVRCNMQMYPV